jgi:hypothetical protein
VRDVRPGPGSESEPGQRRGQILWSGFASKRRLLAADATLRPAAASRFLPLRLEARRDGDRYVLTMTNVTRTSEVAFGGTGKPAELAALLDRTRRDSLAHRRLRPAYVTIQGLVTRRTQKAGIAAPLRVEGELRFPAAVKETINTRRPEGRIVRFGFVLGDEQPLTQRIEVTDGGDPRLRLEARPDIVVRGLTPPGGAPSWVAALKRRRLDPHALLARLIDTRMELVRGDQFQAFLANPDPLGSDRTVYVYATSAASARVAGGSSGGSGGNGALMALLAVGGTVLAAGAALVAWAHS